MSSFLASVKKRLASFNFTLLLIVAAFAVYRGVDPCESVFRALTGVGVADVSIQEGGDGSSGPPAPGNLVLHFGGRTKRPDFRKRGDRDREFGISREDCLQAKLERNSNESEEKMTKLEELEKGTLSRATDDEPIFVLRAKDKLAARTILFWTDIATLAGVSFEKVNEARDFMRVMEKWAEENGGTKTPD